MLDIGKTISNCCMIFGGDLAHSIESLHANFCVLILCFELRRSKFGFWGCTCISTYPVFEMLYMILHSFFIVESRELAWSLADA